MPFPHQNVGTGDYGAGCSWLTKPISHGMPETLDLVQRATFREGMCVPLNNQFLHVFSTAQAIECLSPIMQGRNISVLIAGDSYNRQLFIGLVDILLGRAWNVEITDAQTRDMLMNKDNEEMMKYAKNDPSFPLVQSVCIKECYGQDQKLEFCSRCINQLVKGKPDAIAVVGTFVHVSKRLKNEKAVFNEISKFIGETDNLIFNSNPSYQTSKVPRAYQNASHVYAGERFYDKLLPLMAPYNKTRPFLDFFQLTRSCIVHNCSYDGGHRSRYVNRWKAQLLLNTVCTIEDQHHYL